MAFVRKKGRFYSLVQSVRRGNRVRQKILAYLGSAITLEEAIAGCESELDKDRSRLSAQRTKTAALKADPLKSRLRKTRPFGVYVRDWKWVTLKHYKKREQDFRRAIQKAQKRLAKLKALTSLLHSQSDTPLRPAPAPRTE